MFMNKKDFEDRLSKDMKYKLDTFSMIIEGLDPVEDMGMIADFLMTAREVCQDQQMWEFWVTDTLARLVTLEEARSLLLNNHTLKSHQSHSRVPQLKYSKLRLGSNYKVSVKSGKPKKLYYPTLLQDAPGIDCYENVEFVIKNSVQLVIVDEKQRWRERAVECSKQVNGVLGLGGHAIMLVCPQFIDQFKECTADYLTLRKVVCCETQQLEGCPSSANKFCVCICQKSCLVSPYGQVQVQVEQDNIELPKGLEEAQRNFCVMLETLMKVLLQPSDTLLVYQPFEHSLESAITVINHLKSKTYSRLIYVGAQEGYYRYKGATK
jgi:hypothetical protein